MRSRISRAIFLGGLAATLLASPALRSDELEASEPQTPGALQVERPGGEKVELPLRHTDVRVEINAFVARTTVEQTFSNPFDEPVEAVYTFPLGHDAAVDDFELIVGDRVIRGEIHRREEARQVYENARRAGFQAALLEQERPNIFTQSVANLEPGSDVVVRIRTVEVLRYEAGMYEYVFPLVVGPRYIPGGRAPAAAAAARGAVEDQPMTGSSPPTVAVPDAPRITPPVLRPGFRSGHDVAIDVDLDAGVPVAELSCASHRVLKRAAGRTGYRVRLAHDDTLPNKDFMLRWSVSSETPALGLMAHRTGVDGFFTLLVQPKGEVSGLEAAPKEIVLVLDTSGSMSGVPIEASKRFVHEALKTLGPRDTFNLVRFAGNAEVFSPEPLPNDPDLIARALRWVERLSGGGGTEMLAGFRAAFSLPPDPDRMRMVVFLTDGYIGNEQQILSAIGEVLGQARIYTLGVGSSVNHSLLDHMARLGHGAYVFILPDDEADQAVERFRAWVTRPYLTDIEIDWGALPVMDILPEQPRDLFSGQTLAVVGRYVGAGAGDVVVRGKLGGSYWEQRLAVELPGREQEHAALASVWARHRIRELLLASPGGATPAIEAEVTALALEYRLMSPFTSFVAVDDSRVVNPSGESSTVHQALPVPKGVSFEGVFGAEGPPALRPAPVQPEQVVEDDALRGPAGGISVHVYDSAGQPLPGAMVTIVHSLAYVKETRLITDARGSADFPVLRPGPGYAIKVSFPGFSDIVQSDLRVVGGKSTSIPLTMIAEITEKVKVTAERQVVSLDSTRTSTRFSDDFIHDMPVPGRFYQNVLALAPGVQGAEGAGNPNVHGARDRDFKAIVGGISNVEPLTGQWMSRVNANSIEEMEVITAGAGVEFGQERVRGDARHVLEAAIRVLADLAEDGRLSPAEGRPALAALLAAQREDGALASAAGVHAIATWGLAEAAGAMPDDPWVRGAAEKATAHLLGKTSGPVVDVEAQRWCEMVARWLRPTLDPAAAVLPVDAGKPLLDMLRAAQGVSLTGGSVGRHPLGRLIAALPRGHLKVARM